MRTDFGEVVIRLIVFAFLATIVFFVTDYVTGTTRMLSATVVSKSYVPSSTATGTGITTDSKGNVKPITTTTTTSESYTLIVRLNGHVQSYDADADLWAKAVPGKEIQLPFRYGGLSHISY